MIRVADSAAPIMHGTPEWIAARREFIGGSEIADIMLQGYIDTKLHKTAAAQEAARVTARHQVIMRKAGLAEEWTGNETSHVGSDFEPGFVNLARRKWGWELKTWGSLVYDKLQPRLACTPDFYVDSPWGRGLVQCKMSTASAAEDCKPKKDGSPSEATYADGPPLRYVLQCQAEMACTGLGWATLLVLHAANGQFKLAPYCLRRHDGVVLAIRRAVATAWVQVELMRSGRHE